MSNGAVSPASIQIPPQLAQLLGMFTNLSATAVIFWIVIIEMPAARKEFRTELKEMRDGYGASVKELTSSINKLTDELDRIAVPR